MQHVLITGATGLIGKKLTQQLLTEGFTVSHLSREKRNIPQLKTYLWDVSKNLIDNSCLDGVDTIIHLAGAPIAAKRWTKKRKKEIIDSRVKSIELIYDLIKRVPNKVKHIISASAVGYYGNRGDEWLTEDSKPGDGFLSEVCLLWESAVDNGAELGLNITKLRTCIVLDKNGGALKPLALPVKFGLGTALGNGKQWMPWIHLDDAVGMYVFALKHPQLSGAFNMAAPNPVTNKQLTQAVAKQLRKSLWLPNVPAFLLKLVLGEMSAVVLGSDRVSPKKIDDEGFVFKYLNINTALEDIYE